MHGRDSKGRRVVHRTTNARRKGPSLQAGTPDAMTGTLKAEARGGHDDATGRVTPGEAVHSFLIRQVSEFTMLGLSA